MSASTKSRRRRAAADPTHGLRLFNPDRPARRSRVAPLDKPEARPLRLFEPAPDAVAGDLGEPVRLSYVWGQERYEVTSWDARQWAALATKPADARKGKDGRWTLLRITFD